MIIASFLYRRRRELALCGASVLLHLLALSWLLPQLDRAGAAPSPDRSATIVARLIAAPPRVDPAPAARPAASARPPAHKRRQARPAAAPVLVAAAPAGEPAAVGQGGAAEILADVQSVPSATVATVQPEQAPVEPVAAPPAATAAAPVVARTYQVNMPPSARIVLDVERSDADGARWHGEAVMAWKLRGDSYSMKVEAGIRLLVARVNLVEIASEGRIGEAGFVPVTMTEKRRGRAPTATHFNQRDGRITFSASAASFALLPGAQDKATVPLQLAAIARGDSSQLAGDIEILVGEDKDASVFRFVVLGLEQLETRLGKLQAWHLSRPPRPGAYNSRLDIWLAPAQGWYPVQIRNIESNGAVTTQTVNKIVITDSGT